MEWTDGRRRRRGIGGVVTMKFMTAANATTTTTTTGSERCHAAARRRSSGVTTTDKRSQKWNYEHEGMSLGLHWHSLGATLTRRTSPSIILWFRPMLQHNSLLCCVNVLYFFSCFRNVFYSKLVCVILRIINSICFLSYLLTHLNAPWLRSKRNKSSWRKESR